MLVTIFLTGKRCIKKAFRVVAREILELPLKVFKMEEKGKL